MGARFSIQIQGIKHWVFNERRKREQCENSAHRCGGDGNVRVQGQRFSVMVKSWVPVSSGLSGRWGREVRKLVGRDGVPNDPGRATAGCWLGMGVWRCCWGWTPPLRGG